MPLLSLSPNPANDQLSVTTSLPVDDIEISGEHRLEISDVWGRPCYQTSVINGHTEHRVETGALPNGVYFVRMIGRHTAVERIVIAH